MISDQHDGPQSPLHKQIARLTQERDSARYERDRLRAGLEEVCERIEANGRGTSLEIVTNAFCAEFRRLLSWEVS